jgi:hypothetical protein
MVRVRGSSGGLWNSACVFNELRKRRHCFFAGNNWEHPYVTDGPKSKYWRRANRSFHVAAIFVAIGSLAMFMVGMFSTSDAITHLLENNG